MANNNPFGPNFPGKIPLGGIPVGNSIGFPDSEGWIHPTPGDAINANQCNEDQQSRGASGGCPQDSSQVPNTNKK